MKKNELGLACQGKEVLSDFFAGRCFSECLKRGPAAVFSLDLGLELAEGFGKINVPRGTLSGWSGEWGYGKRNFGIQSFSPKLGLGWDGLRKLQVSKGGFNPKLGLLRGATEI